MGGLALLAVPLAQLPWIGVPMAQLALGLLRLRPGGAPR